MLLGRRGVCEENFVVLRFLVLEGGGGQNFMGVGSRVGLVIPGSLFSGNPPNVMGNSF